jgi:zinc finger protein 830
MKPNLTEYPPQAALAILSTQSHSPLSSPFMSWGNYPVLLSQTMSDVRTLLQRERESRRITHPHLSYSKSGALTCIICSLNVKSETLWEGHLKSANHRKNLREKASSTTGGGGKKRKIEEVAVEGEDGARKRKTTEEEEEGDWRKKRQVSFQVDEPSIEGGQDVRDTEEAVLPGFVRPVATAPQPTPSPPPAEPQLQLQDQPPVDESEWAAFLSEVTPLTSDPSTFTISAPAISASDLAAQAIASGRSRRDEEAEDEKEESEQRLADEFDVMEEMEERVRRLKERREGLRVAGEEGKTEAEKPPEGKSNSESGSEDEDEDEDELDDWFSR